MQYTADTKVLPSEEGNLSRVDKVVQIAECHLYHHILQRKTKKTRKEAASE